MRCRGQCILGWRNAPLSSTQVHRQGLKEARVSLSLLFYFHICVSLRAVMMNEFLLSVPHFLSLYPSTLPPSSHPLVCFLPFSLRSSVLFLFQLYFSFCSVLIPPLSPFLSPSLSPSFPKCPASEGVAYNLKLGCG